MKALVPVAIPILVLTGALSGCAGGMNAMVNTMQYAMQRDRGAAGASVNPAYRYLRVTIEGRVALLVLGYEDPHPDGQVEVWFSAQREVLRIQNGRLVGAAGLPTEWRNVSLPRLPSWSEIARTSKPHAWVRTRDVMPGYRFGLRDALALRPVSPPAKSALVGADPQSLVWFEERDERAELEAREAPNGLFAAALDRGASRDQALPAARYAVDLRAETETVVYAEQCISADLCFTWQRWPVESQRAPGAPGTR